MISPARARSTAKRSDKLSPGAGKEMQGGGLLGYGCAAWPRAGCRGWCSLSLVRLAHDRRIKVFFAVAVFVFFSFLFFVVVIPIGMSRGHGVAMRLKALSEMCGIMSLFLRHGGHLEPVDQRDGFSMDTEAHCCRAASGPKACRPSSPTTTWCRPMRS